MLELEALKREYPYLQQKVDAGELTITFGEKNWNPYWWSERAYVNSSFPFVSNMCRRVPAINKFHLHYDNKSDFMLIDFEFEGVQYQTRFYKVFCLVRMTDKATRTFRRLEDDVVDVFARRQHLDEPKWRKPLTAV